MMDLKVVDRIVTYSIVIGVLLCTASNLIYHSIYFESREDGTEVYFTHASQNELNVTVEFNIRNTGEEFANYIYEVYYYSAGKELRYNLNSIVLDPSSNTSFSIIEIFPEKIDSIRIIVDFGGREKYELSQYL